MAQTAPISIHLHPSFPLGPICLLGIHQWAQPGKWETSATLIAGVYGSILLHEIAHAVVARFHKAESIAIQMRPFGGTTSMNLSAGTSAEAAFHTALAGPMANLILAAGIGMSVLNAEHPWSTGFVLTVINLSIGISNLIPLPALDGGQALQAYRSITSSKADLSCRPCHQASTLASLRKPSKKPSTAPR